jgi:hypothetical protein
MGQLLASGEDFAIYKKLFARIPDRNKYLF